MKLFTKGIDGGAASLCCYFHEEHYDKKPTGARPTILVLPGGGYNFCSDRENEPVAIAFYRAGYNAAVLTYSVGEQARNREPLAQALSALTLLRENAVEWGIDPGKLVVCGFSAGGHLAASCATLWNDAEIQARLDNPGERCRPNAAILGYAVINRAVYDARPYAEGRTKEEYEAKISYYFPVDTEVGPHTPPVFLWHTVTDPVVSVEHALRMTCALEKQGIPFECHLFSDGQHGLSLCEEEVFTPHAHCAHWFGLCLEWLKATL